MARSFSKVKLFSAFLVDEVSVSINRRGFASTTQEMTKKGANMKVVAKKQVEECVASSPWVPDPKTGFYRPENHADEIDVVELRNLLLKQKSH